MYNIGIITYPRIEDGKGRFFQAIALYYAIQDMGYNVEIINYIPREWVRNKKISKKIINFINSDDKKGYIREIKRRFREIYDYNDSEKYKSYIKENNIKYSLDHVWSLEELRNAEFDAWVCGSDQIWNPYFTVGADDVYYLQHTSQFKRISYAASMGTLEIEEKNFTNQIKWIKDFSHISVRELDSCRFLEKYGIYAEYVCDPTFLMDYEWWNELSVDRLIPDKYLLLYLFDDNILPYREAERIAQQNNLKIVCLSNSAVDAKKYITPSGIGPREFVSLFKYADFICTQSFHGTVLSLIYKKNFLTFEWRNVYKLNGLILRVKDLLDIAGISNRIVYNDKEDQEMEIKPIDYESVNKRIKHIRMKSYTYLKESIESSVNI